MERILVRERYRGLTIVWLMAAMLVLAVFAGPAIAAPLPVNTCVYDLASNTRTCELWAATGTLSLPGPTTVPIWGYADAAGGPVSLPGPTLIANQGENVVVILHNGLSEATALHLQGQSLIPDLTGVPAGGTATYSFVASQPGTYLYEAGLLPNAQHQVTMGMFGALIVRPAGTPGQAYGDTATAFDEETLVILSEVDPALNTGVDPASFDMRNFHPRFWLVNGKAYPNTAPIVTMAGHKLLLRYINAGLVPHTMSLLGLRQTLLATDGNLLPYSRKVVGNTVGPGQTFDALVTVTPDTTAGTRLALYDGSLLLHNNGAAGLGGMLIFLDVVATLPPAGGPPVTTNAVAAPSPANGTVPVTITAHVVADPSTTVVAAEYFIDAVGADGSGTPMTALDLVLDSATEDVMATILAADVAALPGGTHTIYVHGQDSAMQWGALATASLMVTKSGPTVSSVTVMPHVSDGTVPLMVTAMLSADATAAELYIDGTAGTAMAMMMTGTPGEWMGTIPASSLASLTTGHHNVYVRGQDADAVWGVVNLAPWHLDKDGPATTGLVLTPNPSNGSLPITISGTGNDMETGMSNVQAAEYFAGAIGLNGAGMPMTVNAVAPIVSLGGTIPPGLAEGSYTIYVHSQDAFSHWGSFAALSLAVDRTGPTTSNVVAAPNPNNGAMPISPGQPSVRVDARISEPGAGPVASNVKTAEGFMDVIGADGSGFPFTPRDGLFSGPVEDAYAFIPLTTIALLPDGIHQIWVHGQDSSGNWGPAVATDLVIERTSPAVGPQPGKRPLPEPVWLGPPAGLLGGALGTVYLDYFYLRHGTTTGSR